MMPASDDSEREAFMPKSSDATLRKASSKDENAYNAKVKVATSQDCSQYSRRAHFWICYSQRKKMVCFGAILILLITLMKNSYSVRRTKKVAAGAYIQSDYSNVKSLNDLETINSSIDNFCFVSLYIYI